MDTVKTWIKIEPSEIGITKLNMVNQNGNVTTYYLDTRNGKVYQYETNTIYKMGYKSVSKFVKHKKFKKCNK